MEKRHSMLKIVTPSDLLFPHTKVSPRLFILSTRKIELNQQIKVCKRQYDVLILQILLSRFWRKDIDLCLNNHPCNDAIKSIRKMTYKSLL